MSWDNLPYSVAWWVKISYLITDFKTSHLLLYDLQYLLFLRTSEKRCQSLMFNLINLTDLFIFAVSLEKYYSLPMPKRPKRRLFESIEET